MGDSLDILGLKLASIYPWIEQDVTKKLQEVDNRRMLKYMLVDCTGKPQESFNESDRTKLLDNCLREVLPICNGDKNLVKNLEMIESRRIKESLKAYAESRSEKSFYAHFVTAMNTALLLLRDLETEHVRSADASCAVYFHVSDPTVMKQDYLGQTSKRKPDVLLVSNSDIPGLDGSVENLLALTTKPPQDAFEWRCVRTFVEFKRSKTKKKMDPPPPSYAHQQEKAVVIDSQSPETELKSSQPTRKRPRLEYLTDMAVEVQAGYYAAEMLAAHTSRLHVIGLVIFDDMLYIWRYDRQGAIQCSGLNIIQDLPLFLVLLLAMQRFEDQHWGLNPDMDPKFGTQPKAYEMTLRGEDGREITVTLGLSDKIRRPRYGLDGRGTNLLSAEIKNSEDDLVVKVSWPEAVRVSEHKILEEVHVPVVVWSKKFEHRSTARIREYLGLTGLELEGARVLYMIIFRKLKPITELDGDKFLCAWWATVKCHLALWKNGIRHRDISPFNLMYYEDGENIVGVLNDFDLASIEESVTAAQCTGTIPYMALDLLTEEGIRGEITHSYEHDAESFIWVLTWISLQYEDGKPHRRHPTLDEWQKVNPVPCGAMRTAFLFQRIWRKLLASRGHEGNWELAKKCLVALGQRASFKLDSEDPFPTWDIDTAFEKLLKGPYSQRS